MENKKIPVLARISNWASPSKWNDIKIELTKYNRYVVLLSEKFVFELVKMFLLKDDINRSNSIFNSISNLITLIYSNGKS